MKGTQPCLTLCNPMDCSLRAPLSLEFSRQENWSVTTPSSRGLPDPGIKPSLHTAGGLLWNLQGQPRAHYGLGLRTPLLRPARPSLPAARRQLLPRKGPEGDQGFLVSLQGAVRRVTQTAWFTNKLSDRQCLTCSNLWAQPTNTVISPKSTSVNGVRSLPIRDSISINLSKIQIHSDGYLDLIFWMILTPGRVTDGHSRQSPKSPDAVYCLAVLLPVFPFLLMLGHNWLTRSHQLQAHSSATQLHM